MKFSELIQTIREKKEKIHPHIIALEGIIGSGKSYEAEKLKEELGGKTILLSTDLFVTVDRHEWTQRVQHGSIDLREWYDLPKVKKTLESIKKKEVFTITGLYDLSNGQFDDQIEVNATECDYMILEGLFSCDESLDGLVDIKIFLNVSLETAMKRAEARDESVRHLDHHGWELKKTIFYDNYLPYLGEHKKRADIILDVD
ncbi:MAG TPA: AAA family ATPase [Thermodesulfobacteriota bacterium]|nr:AAA family ATPase [Thermodesulfobacteriota bacterium]